MFLVNRTVAQKLCETSGLLVEMAWMACCEPCEVAARVHTAAVIEKRMDQGCIEGYMRQYNTAVKKVNCKQGAFIHEAI